MVTCRRRNSCPTQGRSRRHSRLNSSNPYIGTFRHAPPTFSSAEYLKDLLRSDTLLKSPYVGSFRHAPATNVMKLTDWVSGNLRGGCEKIVVPPFSTTDLVRNVACWLFQSFQQETLSCSKRTVQTEKYCDESQGSSVSSLSDHDYITPTSSPAFTSQPEPRILSQQMLLQDESRLDYCITQMDVINMMRNASKHLDVDSIRTLPVKTYESKDVEGSWLLVDDDKDICVICLEQFVNGDRLRVLPCQHS
jgi:hypothetical protein